MIWSATSMKWIEEKMKLLGCDKHPGYKLAFYLDSRAMISIHSDKYGVIEVSKSILFSQFSLQFVHSSEWFSHTNFSFLHWFPILLEPESIRNYEENKL